MCNRFHISHFHVCWSVVTRGCVFPAVLSNSCQKTTMADFRYKSLKSWKIDNIDLTQQFSLSIFTDFRYQSIKITWLLPIYIDWLLRVEITMLLLAPKFPITLPLLIDENHAMFHSVSLICFCHQSSIVVMLYLSQICFYFYYVKVNKTQVILFILFYFISFANII